MILIVNTIKSLKYPNLPFAERWKLSYYIGFEDVNEASLEKNKSNKKERTTGNQRGDNESDTLKVLICLMIYNLQNLD